MDVLGKAIRRKREELGLTAKELGEKTGLHQVYIYEIELEKKTPSVKSLEKIARALGLQMGDLFNEGSSFSIEKKDWINVPVYEISSIRKEKEEKQWKDERGKARKRLGELQKQKENILAAIAKGLGWDFAQEKVNQITAGITEAERLLSESAPKKTQIDEREGAYLLLEDITHVRDELLHDRAAQRGILAAFVEEIVLKDGFATIRWKIPLPDKKICT